MLLTEWNMETALEVRYDEGVTKGVAIGEAKGRTEGVAIGRTEGVAIGEARGEAKVTKIFELLEKGMSLKEIKKSIRGT